MYYNFIIMNKKLILSIDTSTEFCSATLMYIDNKLDNNKNLYSYWTYHEKSNEFTIQVLPEINKLFKKSGFSLTDCNAIAFGSGPGSFTGIRIATGITQGLGFGLNIPVIPICTLLIYAEMSRLINKKSTRVLVLIDAKMNEVYWADYSWDDLNNEWKVIHSPSVSSSNKVIIPDEKFTISGNNYISLIKNLSKNKQKYYIYNKTIPYSYALASIAIRKFNNGKIYNADEIYPKYIRNKITYI